MISSLEVGSVFRLVDDASPTLQNITRELKLLNEQSARAKELLGSISQTAFKAAPSGALDDVIGNAKPTAASLNVLGLSSSARIGVSPVVTWIAPSQPILWWAGVCIGTPTLGPLQITAFQLSRRI